MSTVESSFKIKHLEFNSSDNSITFALFSFSFVFDTFWQFLLSRTPLSQNDQLSWCAPKVKLVSTANLVTLKLDKSRVKLCA